MKRSLDIYLKLLTPFFILYFIGVADVYAQNPSEVVTQYFEAMQRGEVECVKYHLSGNLLKKRIVLLEQNKKYGSFLRNLYKDAEFIVSNDSNNLDNQSIVDFSIAYPDGNTYSGSLVLEQVANGEWKIVDHL